MTTTMIWRSRAVLLAVTALSLLMLAARASAQTVPMDFRHGTTLAGFVGAQTASSDVSPAAGVGLGWEVTRRLSFEGRGTWFGVNEGPSDFVATLGAHVALLTPRTVVPFVAAGAGMYRATLDSTAENAPAFYRTRMASDVVGVRTRTFQDFLVTVGGGVNVFVSSHVALRPEANLMLVTTRSDSRPLAEYGMQVVYHFEAQRVGQ
jgi:outer membrane protein with beta-barrel domain